MTLIERIHQRTVAVGIVVLVSAGVLATVFFGGSRSPVVAEATLNLNYPTYDSLSSLAARAEVIAVGTVRTQSARPVQMVPPDMLAQLPEYKKQGSFTVVTDHEVVLQRELKGGDSNVITVVQPGGTLGNRRFINHEENALRKNGTYLLFLRRGNDGKYFILGGQQGAYEVASGRLKVQNAAARDVRLELSGRSVDSVAGDPALRSSVVEPAPQPLAQGEQPASAPPEKLQAKTPGS